MNATTKLPKLTPHPMVAALAAPLLVLAMGCSGNDRGADPVGQSSEAVTVCAGSATVEGVDVSEYQATIDWASVKASGRSFAIARVSDGTGHLDTTFAANWAGIKNAGMVRGVYQFFRASDDPVAQANLLVSNIGTLGADDISPVADIEVLDGETGATLIANLTTWVARIKAATGRTPLIYSAPGFWDALPSTAPFSSEVLWVANWQVTCPDTPTPWTSWSFWQYADNGTVAGITGNVDLDRFNGSLAALQQPAADAGASTSGGWGASYVSQSFPLASTPITLMAGQTLSGDIELKNIGTKSWDSNTRLGTTQPRDRTSVFADSTWVAPNRPAAVSGSVAPGDTYKFQFTLHAPDKPGTYAEYFGVLEESVAWFSDTGQGGPPDSQLEVQVIVTASDVDGGSGSTSNGDGGAVSHAGDAATGGAASADSGEGSALHPGDGGAPEVTASPSDGGGCSVGLAGKSSEGLRVLAAFALVLAARRRRSTR